MSLENSNLSEVTLKYNHEIHDMTMSLSLCNVDVMALYRYQLISIAARIWLK